MGDYGQFVESIEHITVRQAAQHLENRMQGGRPVYPHEVERMKSVILSVLDVDEDGYGWDRASLHELVLHFDMDGRLVAGKHTLMAAIELQVDINYPVRRDVAPPPAQQARSEVAWVTAAKAREDLEAIGLMEEQWPAFHPEIERSKRMIRAHQAGGWSGGVRDLVVRYGPDGKLRSGKYVLMAVAELATAVELDVLREV